LYSAPNGRDQPSAVITANTFASSSTPISGAARSVGSRPLRYGPHGSNQTSVLDWLPPDPCRTKKYPCASGGFNGSVRIVRSGAWLHIIAFTFSLHSLPRPSQL